MRTRTSLALTSVIALALAGVVASPAQAATFTAATEAELVAHIATANGNSQADTITLTGSGFALTGNLPNITDTLTIVGPGSGTFTLDIGPWTGFSASSFASFSLSGITIVSGNSPVVQTTSVDATLSDLVVDGLIYHENGDFSASNIDVTTSPTNRGLDVRVYSADTAQLSNITVTDTFFEGIFVLGSGTSSITVSNIDVQAAGLDYYAGMSVDLSDRAGFVLSDSVFSGNFGDGLRVEAYDTANVLIERVIANDNGMGSDGIDVDADQDSTATIRDSSAARNGDNGFESDFDGGSGSFANVTARDNLADGFDIEADSGAQITVSNAVATGNGDRGVMLEPDTPDSMITMVGGRAEGNGEYGLFLNIDQGVASSTGFVSSNNDVGGVLIQGYNGQATLHTAVVEGNNLAASGSAGGIDIEAFDDGDGPLDVLIERTTVSGSGGPGISGMVLDGSTVEIVNTTISGNTAEHGGAIELEGNVESALTIVHSTITLNQSTFADSAAVVVEGGMPTTIDHTIIAGNSGGAGTVDLAGLDADLDVDYSLVGAADAGAGAALTAGTGNIVGQGASLAPLADNGGPTRTHLPLAGSPAIGAGNPAIVGAPATDQRGEDRVIGVVEIGAVELQAPELAATGASESVATLAAGIVLLFVLGGSLLMVARRRQAGSMTR